MEESEQSSSSLGNTLRRIGETILNTLRNRFELLSLELQEEKARLIATVICLAAALFFGILAIIVVTVTIVAFCPPESRPYVLLGFSVLYVALTLGSAVALKRQLKDRPPPLSDSISELRKDITWIRSRR